jgi:hypothetical protein
VRESGPLLRVWLGSLSHKLWTRSAVSTGRNARPDTGTHQRVFVGEEEHTAGPGTVAALPRCVSHAYVVTSATARFLTLHTPAGFEQFVTEVGEPARALTLPPPPAGPPDFAALAQAAARHRITILAPPPQP